MAQRISESLELVEQNGKSQIKCSKCKQVLCTAEENYKLSAVYAEFPLSKAGPKYFFRPSDKFILREYYCPSCGILFEVEMLPKGMQPVWNIEMVS